MTTSKKSNRKAASLPGKRPKQPPVAKQGVPRSLTNGPARRVSRAREIAQVCAITDPFCMHANGSKYMDNSATRSIPYSTHTRYSIPSNVSGNASVIIVPNYFYDPIVFGTINAGSSTWDYGTLTNGGANPASTAYRVTSFGVIVRNLAAPLNASGMIRIRGFSAKTGTALGTINTDSYNCDFYYDLPLQNCSGLAVVGRRLDPTAMNWQSATVTTPSATFTQWQSPGFGCFTVSLEGGPAVLNSVNFDVEIIMNFEMQLADDNNLSQLATAPLKVESAIATAQQVVSSTAINVFERGVKEAGSYLEKKAVEALSSLVFLP